MGPLLSLQLLTLCHPVFLTKHHATLCSLRVIVSIVTSFFDLTSQHMMCDMGLMSSGQEWPAATSCCLQTSWTALRQPHTTFCTHGSWGHTMWMWSTQNLGSEIMQSTALIFYGFDGTRLLTQGLLGGAITHWIPFASLLYMMTILLDLWIW